MPRNTATGVVLRDKSQLESLIKVIHLCPCFLVYQDKQLKLRLLGLSNVSKNTWSLETTALIGWEHLTFECDSG